MEEDITPAVLTERQAARYCGVGYSTFRADWAPEIHCIQRVQPYGRKGYLREDLDKHLRKLRRPPIKSRAS